MARAGGHGCVFVDLAPASTPTLVQLERVLPRAGSSNPPTSHGIKALLAAGILAFRQGDYDAAGEQLHASPEGARRLGDDRAAAEAMRKESRATCRTQGYLWCIPYLLEYLDGLAIARRRARWTSAFAGAGDRGG